MLSYDKFCGCLYGLAIGDALGMPYEFINETHEYITEMNKSSRFNLKAGTWTDDTSLTLCLADSILELEKYDETNNLLKYSNWYKNGYLSCESYSFGIGKATKNALEAFIKNNSIINGNETTLGNGVVMRITSLIMLSLNNNIKEIAELCKRETMITHNNNECIIQSARFGLVLYYILHDNICKIKQVSKNILLPTWIQQHDGKAITTIDNAFHAILENHDFKNSLIYAVNIPGDSDTVGAITGAIAGALYGYSAIPEQWLKKLRKKEIIEKYVKQMWNFITERQIKL